MPAVAVVIEAVRGTLPGAGATIGVATVIIGVAIVNHPRAETPTGQLEQAPPVPYAESTGAALQPIE